MNKVLFEKLMATLKPRDRKLIELWLFEEMHADDIGKLLGKKGSTIRYHRQKILQRLRKYLEERD